MGMRLLNVKLIENLGKKYRKFKWAIMDHLDSDFHVFYTLGRCPVIFCGDIFLIFGVPIILLLYIFYISELL